MGEFAVMSFKCVLVATVLVMVSSAPESAKEASTPYDVKVGFHNVANQPLGVFFAGNSSDKSQHGAESLITVLEHDEEHWITARYTDVVAFRTSDMLFRAEAFLRPNTHEESIAHHPHLVTIKNLHGEGGQIEMIHGHDAKEYIWIEAHGGEVTHMTGNSAFELRNKNHHPVVTLKLDQISTPTDEMSTPTAEL